MTDKEIEQIALANGFELKPQPGGGMALHPHVFAFARALLDAQTAKHINMLKALATPN